MAKKKANNKIVDGLTTLLEGFKVLEEGLAEDYGTESDLSAALISEVSTAIDAVVDQDEFNPAFIASVVATMTSALKELDPEIFENDEEEEDDDDEEAEDGGEEKLDLDEDDYYEDR